MEFVVKWGGEGVGEVMGGLNVNQLKAEHKKPK